MKLVSECTIDLDQKRKIWISSSTELKEGEAAPEKVIQAQIEGVTTQALAAHEMAVARIVIQGASAEERAPSERPKRPDDPPTMRAMGED